MDDVTKALKGAKKLIRSPLGWCQGHMVRDRQGQRVESIWSSEATKYDAYAALAKMCIEPGDDDYAHDLHHRCLLIMHNALREIEGKTDLEECSIMIYNDNHTHDEILSLFDKAIELVGKYEKEIEICERSSPRNERKQKHSRVPEGQGGRKSALRRGHDSDAAPKAESKRCRRSKFEKANGKVS